LPTRHLRRFEFLIALALGCAAAHPAIAGDIDWDLSAIGLAGASDFTADALKATEVSHIIFTGPTTFFEHGFAQVTGILDNGNVSTPTGLNSTYSLYFDFTATGDLVTNQFTTFGMTLYGVNGASVFGLDASNNAFVDNGLNTPIELATNVLISGTIGGGPGTDLSADSFSIFSSTLAGAPVFLSPDLPSEFHGAFFHSMLEPGGITLVADGIALHGGDDTLTFIPEPSSLLLLFGGLPAILLLRRRA
jgi:hypothetical protein